jgi:cytoskeletal protein CcmA (bactofilin family)
MQMFNPSRKTEPAAPGIQTETPIARPQPPNGATDEPRSGGILSSGVSITGTLTFRNELLIDCKVDGTIDSGGRLTIGKNARIKGEIRTKSVIVDGAVEGDITAEERCELRAGCTVNGDIASPRLVVDEEASFIGSARIASTGKAATT